MFSTNGSNKALERTATRFAFTFCVARTSSLRATRAFGGPSLSFFSLDAMQLLNRLLVVLFFGFFGAAALLTCYSSYRQQQSGVVSVERGNDFPGSWVVLIFFTLFGLALC